MGAVAELARRAEGAGRLRSDFVLDDLILVLMADKGIHATSAAAQVKASRRFAGLVIQAFEACPRHAPLPPAARLASAGEQQAPAGARSRPVPDQDGGSQGERCPAR
ncbi:hypothetical protein [Streptomyces sp. NBC_01213]|uniref:hypothetical protein n=1 Tax=Streptomyces sp. NBC_01213 TaxID=2903776 RepID=UPI00352D7FD8